MPYQYQIENYGSIFELRSILPKHGSALKRNCFLFEPTDKTKKTKVYTIKSLELFDGVGGIVTLGSVYGKPLTSCGVKKAIELFLPFDDPEPITRERSKRTDTYKEQRQFIKKALFSYHNVFSSRELTLLIIRGFHLNNEDYYKINNRVRQWVFYYSKKLNRKIEKEHYQGVNYKETIKKEQIIYFFKLLIRKFSNEELKLIYEQCKKKESQARDKEQAEVLLLKSIEYD